MLESGLVVNERTHLLPSRPQSHRRERRTVSSHYYNKQVIESFLLKEERKAESPKLRFSLRLEECKVVEDEEYTGFRTLYGSVWGKLRKALGLIEKFAEKQQLSKARLDSDRVVEIGLRRSHLLQEDLFNCFEDKLELLLQRIEKVPFRYFGKEGKVRAADRIKSVWLGSRVRKAYLVTKRLSRAALRIQGWWRHRLEVKRFRARLVKHQEEVYTQYCKRQQDFKRRFQQISNSAHVEIHVVSSNRGELQRLGTAHLLQRRNCHHLRVFRVKHSRLKKIIFVSPFPLSDQIRSYYYKMLELGDVSDARARVSFMAPESDPLLLPHLSTYSLVLYSSPLLKRLANIARTSACFIVPGEPSLQLVRLSHALQVPVFSGDPQKGYLMGLKSESKRLFKEAGLALTLGSIQVFDEGELVSTLAVLCSKYPDIEEWLLKTEDTCAGRGIASLKAGRIEAMKRLARRTVPSERSKTQKSDLSHFHDAQNQEVVNEGREVLVRKLPHCLRPFYPQVYPSYKEYMRTFLGRGGIVQAFRKNAVGLTATFLLSPEGSVQLLSVVERISQNCKPVGCLFPQKVLSRGFVESVCRQLAQTLHLRQMFGYFTLDLLVFEEDGHLQYEASGLTCGLTEWGLCSELANYLLDGYEQLESYLVSHPSTQQTCPTRKETELFEKHVAKQGVFQPVHRVFLYVPYFHTFLGGISISPFFKAANLRQVRLDLNRNVGTAFLLLDQLQSEVLGFLLCCESRAETGAELERVVQLCESFDQRSRKERSEERGTEMVRLREVAQFCRRLRRE